MKQVYVKAQKLSSALTTAAVAGMMAWDVHAGSAVMQTADGESMRYEYRGDAMRMSYGSGDDYSLVVDGKLYAVTFEGGEPTVIDASAMIQNLSSMMPDSTPDELSAEVLDMSPTGRTERVAGISGDVYEVRIKGDDGKERTEQLVLSQDPRARELAKSLLRMAELISEFVGEDTTQRRDDIADRLDVLDAGLLRFGSDLVVTEISDEVVSLQRFELPAEPMDLGGMGALLGSMGGQNYPGEDAAELGDANSEADKNEGGAFSSMMKAFGNKVDRQVGRVTNSANNEVDRETDEAVDKGINKVFGKLFGN